MVGVDYCVPLNNFDPLFVGAVVLMFSVIALFFMLGRILPRSKWEAIARNEFRQVLISVILGVALVGLASASCALSSVAMKEVVKSPFTDQFRHSEQYINILINGVGAPTIKSFWILSYTLSASTATLRVGKVRVGGIGSMMAKIIDRVISPLYAILIASLTIQLMVIQFSQVYAFTMVLPIGMILRTLEPTREGGSFLIALAFGLYMVFPFTYVANYEVSNIVWKNLNFEQLKEVPDVSKVAFKSFGEIFGLLIYLVNNLSLLMPQATVLPLISMTLSVGFVRVFADYINKIR